MITLCQNVRQPNCRYPAPTQALLQPVAIKMMIEKSGNPSRTITDSKSGKSSIRSVVMVRSMLIAIAYQKFTIS
jgi:hypothetical protein